VLAADQAAELPDVRVEDREIARVALAPEHALGEGRHQFTVPAEHRAVGREEYQAVVDRMNFRPGVHLVATERDVHPCAPDSVRDALAVLARHDQRVVPE
jgi:hypothetical protein